MFQSLSGFQARCDGARLQPNVRSPPMFQSLSGFQARCDWTSAVTTLRQRTVSIPVGFSSSLRCHDVDFYEQLLDMFQSLSGFQARCDRTLAYPYWMLHTWRFNPCRVFKLVAMARDCRQKSNLYLCFNPCRVFKLVAIAIDFGSCQSRGMFQSLSGFQARCDCCHNLLQRPKDCVSIPVGFSSSLRWRVKKGPFTLKSFLKARKLTSKKWTFGVPSLYKDPLLFHTTFDFFSGAFCPRSVMAPTQRSQSS